MKRIALLVTLALALSACGQSDPKTFLLGQWKEDMTTAKWETIRAKRADRPESMPLERTIHFFQDGTAALKSTYADPLKNRTISFTWSLSENGQTLKTDDPELARILGPNRGVSIMRIASLTKKELKIDEPGTANGYWSRP